MLEERWKSTVFLQLQNRTINTEETFIFMQFDTDLGICENHVFIKEFFMHHWDERFANQLLLYIKNSYKWTYFNSF